MGTHHRNALLRSGRFELAGLCDPALPALPEVTAPLWDRLETALERLRPDAVLLALPPASHDRAARLCLEAGAHVLLEKPLTPHCDTSRSLVEDFRRRGLVLHPALCERHNPVRRAAVPLARQLGRLESVEIERSSPGQRPEHGIDVALDLAIHDLDLLACDHPGLEVGHRLREPSRLRLELTAPQAPSVVLEARWNAPAPRRLWRLQGQRGRLELDFLARTLRRDGNPVAVPEQDALEAQLEHFSLCLEGKADPGTESALKAQEWLDYPTKATASISTFTSRGKRPTSMVERAGA